MAPMPFHFCLRLLAAALRRRLGLMLIIFASILAA